jgi:hypothetical protein
MKRLVMFLKLRAFVFGALMVLPSLTARADAPAITSEPTNFTASAGSTASFTVVATGTAPLSYRWSRDGAPVPGTSATLTLPNVSDSQAGGYVVVVTNASGSVTSAPPAILTVTHPPVITVQPESQVVAAGDEALFTVDVNGATPFTYQWWKNSAPVSGETEDSLDLFPVMDSDAASYAVAITNSDGTAASAAALLTVIEPELETSQPIGSPIDTCSSITLTVITHGTDGSLHYQWYFGANPIGADSPSYSIPDVTLADAGTYSVDVSNSAGSSATASATFAVQVPIPATRNITVQLDESGMATITPAQVDAGPTGYCTIINRVVSPSSFNCGNVGSNQVTLTVTDNMGNSASNTAVVTVQDTNAPTVVFNTISVTLDATGNYTLSPADVSAIAAGSTEACGIASNNVSPSTFTFCDVGTKAVTLTVTDVNGNVATSNATITVVAPVASPAVVYVDTNYTGACAGVPFPFIGGTGTYYIGYNAFNTLQAGISAVASGGTVNVAPGNYGENLNITKSVSVISSGGRNLTTITLQTEGSVYADTILINASSVSVKGFTVAGFNATTGIDGDLAGIDFLLNPGVTNVEIASNAIEVGNISASSNGDDGKGVLTTYDTSAPFADSLNIHDNIFSALPTNTESVVGSRAFYINPVVANFTFASNTITGNLYHSTTEADNSLIEDNVVEGTGTADGSGGFGIYSSDPPVNGHATIKDNVITNTQDAILLFDSADVVIENNLLDDNGTGVLLEDASGGVDSTGDQIVFNSFSNSVTAGVDNETAIGTPNAVSNWWGNVSGPHSATLNPYGTGSAVIGSLTIAPWLGSGVNTQPDVPGFYPNLTPIENPPSQLVFTLQPVGADLGSPLSIQPVVQVEDSNGNVTPWADPAVTAALGNNLTGGVLAGTNPQLAVNGIATFTDLSVTVAGSSNFTLVASAPNLATAVSDSFAITNPVPAVASLSPFFARAGGAGFTLTVNGSDFVADSVVNWNGNPLVTAYVSPAQVTATVPASDIASVGPAGVTVASPGPGGGISGSLTFDVDVANPPVVYVDTNYVGLAANTLVNWPYTGSGTHIIGYDAFATIQDGADGVASGGTVNVAAGTYVEDLTIDQPLSLIGPNANINPNTGTRVPEAVIEPATSDPNPYDANPVIVVYVSASGVTMKGFTVDGNNPGITSGVIVGGVDVDAAEGIVSYEGVGSITVKNNIVKDTTYTGVDFYNYTSDAATADNYITCNRFDNLGSYGFGIGVLIYNNFYAKVSDNVMTNVVVGVQTGNFSQSDPGTTQSIDDNRISANAVGVFFNLMYDQTSTFSVSNNAICFAYVTNSPEWDGMLIGSIQSTVGVQIVSNTITGTTTNEATVGYPTVGYNVWNTPSTVGPTIQGGSITNANYGVWVNNWDGYDSQGDSTKATISGVSISGASVAGVYVQDDPRSANGSIVRATVTGNTVITGSGVGVWVQGTNAGASVLDNAASITGNGTGVAVDTGVALLEGNDLSGNSVAGISTTNNAVVDAGDCSGSDATGLDTGTGLNGSSAGGNNLSGYGFDGVAPWAILNENTSPSAPIYAEQDLFGAGLADSLAAAFSDSVNGIHYSQNPLLASAPATVNVECVSEVPPAAATLASFLAQGGTVTANSVTVSSVDVPPIAPETTTVRTYMLSDGCVSTNCPQTIIVHEVTPPTIGACPANFVSPGPTVNYTLPGATDNCGPTAVHVVGSPPPGSNLPPGVNTIVCTAVNNAGLTNSCSFEVVVPNPTLSDAYVDASYGSLPPGTSVTWPNSGGTGSHFIGFDAFATVQGGVNAVQAGGTVHVAAGTYTESVAANKSVVLDGANMGVAGCGTRGAESVINGGGGIAVDVQSDGVTVDGFALQGATGLRDIGHQSLIAQNNAISTAPSEWNSRA